MKLHPDHAHDYYRYPLIGNPPRYHCLHRRGRSVTGRILPPNLESVRAPTQRCVAFLVAEGTLESRSLTSWR
jgi:hypothetical protein